MGNTISQPITYGPHMMRDLRAEQAIRFLEDENNNSKPIPEGLLLDSELDYLNKYGSLKCAGFIRRGLQGGIIG